VVRESPELTAIARRWLDAWMDADGAAMANLLSRHEATRYIGTDPIEFWRGTEAATAIPAHVVEIKDRVTPRFELSHLEAFENERTGWAIIVGTVHFAAIASFELRAILIFVLEEGVWRVIMAQNGLAIPNIEAVKVEITAGIESLLGEMDDDGESTIRDSISEGTVALMFTDIVDSTAWLTQLGDEQWTHLVGWHDEMVRGVVERHGGVVVKTLGDGAMAAFDSTRSAARAAREIQETMELPSDRPDIEVRIGLHVGEVMQTGDDFLGQAVNKAARIASAAAGGEIRVSNAVAALLGDTPEFEFGAPVETVLKGLDGMHSVLPLVWR
jgi:class 3 adenylate cyclase